MWHEARKQEKKIRGMLVDFRKRADRRKEFYEKIRADPTQFLQLHGRKCKINFETDVADESQHMMPWQGNSDCQIDRFDVRAHLDYIPPQKAKEEAEPELTTEERQINYERYRVLAQNEFLGISEEKFLHQLVMEEQFGTHAHQLESEKSKKKHSSANAAIGFNYDVNEAATVPFIQTISSIEAASSGNRFEEFSKDYSDDSEIDDMDGFIDVTKMGTIQANELNNCSLRYGMLSNDFFSFLTKDEDEKQSLRALKEQEADKVVGTGRKSRRERRSQREKRILGNRLSPPSYAAKEEKPNIIEEDKSSSSSSRSPSPENAGKITYITSFGGEDELQPHPKISITLNKPMPSVPGANRRRAETSSYAEKVKQNLDSLKKVNEVEKDRTEFRRRISRSPRCNSYRSRSRSTSRRRYRRSRSLSRKRRRRSSSTSSSDSSRSRSKRSTKRSTSSSSSSTSSKRSLDHSTKKRSVTKSKSPERPRRSTSSHNNEESSSIKRYYGRRKGNESSSSLSIDSDNNEGDNKTGSNDSSTNDASKLKSYDRSAVSKASSRSVTAGTSSSSNNNPRERLKKKMQILLNKQYKADKRAETERMEKQQQEAILRDEQMRELSLKLRKRQRELRHNATFGDGNQSESDASLTQEKTNKPKSRSSSSAASSSEHLRSRSLSRSRDKLDRKSPIDISKSPVKYVSRSPMKYVSRSPMKYVSRSPMKYVSRSPMKYVSRSPMKYVSRSPVRYDRSNRSPFHDRRRQRPRSRSRSAGRNYRRNFSYSRYNRR